MSGPNIFPGFFLTSPFLEIHSKRRQLSSFSEFGGRAWTNSIRATSASDRTHRQAQMVFHADSNPMPHARKQLKKEDFEERKEFLPIFEQNLEEPCPPSPPTQLREGVNSDVEGSPSLQYEEGLEAPLSPKDLFLPDSQVQENLERVQQIFVEVDDILSEKTHPKTSPPAPPSPLHPHFCISPDLRLTELDVIKELDETDLDMVKELDEIVERKPKKVLGIKDKEALRKKRRLKQKVNAHLLEDPPLSIKQQKLQLIDQTKRALLEAVSQKKRESIKDNFRIEWKSIKAKEKEKKHIICFLNPESVREKFFAAITLIRKEKQEMSRLNQEGVVIVDQFLDRLVDKRPKNRDFLQDARAYLEWLTLRMTIENDIEQYSATKNEALLDIIQTRFREKVVVCEETSPFYRMTTHQIAVIQRILNSLTGPHPILPLNNVQRAEDAQPKQGTLKKKEAVFV